MQNSHPVSVLFLLPQYNTYTTLQHHALSARPPSSSPSSLSLILSALLSELALLLCHGVFPLPSFGVLGRLPLKPGLTGGCRALCAEPCACNFAPLTLLTEFWRLVVLLPAVLLLQRRSRPSMGRRRPSRSMSGVGVVLRLLLRECEVSRPRTRSMVLGRRLREMLPVWLCVWRWPW